MAKKEDKNLKLCSDLITKWFKFKIPGEDHIKLKYAGVYISSCRDTEIESRRGEPLDWDTELIGDVVDKLTRLYLDVRVGTKRGVARVLKFFEVSPNYEDHVGYRHRILKDLETIINAGMSDAVKEAVTKYKEYEGKAAEKGEDVFEQLTHSVPVESIGQFRKHSLPLRAVRRIGMKLSGLLDGDPSIVDSSVTMGCYLEWRRLVVGQSSHLRIIKDTPLHYFYVEPKLTILNKDNELVETNARYFFKNFNDLKNSALEKNVLKFRNDSLEVSNGLEFRTSTVPVYTDSNPSSILFHEPVGHPLEGDNFSENEKFFTVQNYGEQIAPEWLNIECVPEMEGSVANGRYDFEGMPVQNVKVIENGRLVGMPNDQNSASKIKKLLRQYGKEPIYPIVPGNARMDVWDYELCASSPRPYNYKIYSTKPYSSRDELWAAFLDLIAKTPDKRGVYITGHNSGESLGRVMNVNFQIAWLVNEKGELTPLKQVRIDENNLMVMNRLVGMTRRKEYEMFFCGHPVSGVIPTNVYTGAALFDGLVLSPVALKKVTAPYRLE